jgi:hypothetical protein
MRVHAGAALLFLLLPTAVPAQQSAQPSEGQPQTQETDRSQMPAQMPGMHMGVNHSSSTQAQDFLQEIVNHASSGTDAEPTSTPAAMPMKMTGHWMLMFHANVFVVNEQQTSARGRDGFFSTNWFMPMAQRKLGPGTFTARVMVSLEPATVTGRRYPLLFQQGETAFGRPIADGQHPHNFFMELAAMYDLKLGPRSLLSFYAAPVGDPALGPAAYPHRASASQDPVATLGHHQQDSTHIAADVITVGVTRGSARIEASGFHGREPGERRWSIEQGRIDSWSTRLTFQPGKHWSGQYSYGRIRSPEALFPTEDQERMTASIMYNRAVPGGNWATTLAWGRTRSLSDRAIFNSYLAESTLRFRARNYVWARVENADRSSELILGENPLPPGFEEGPIGRVQAYTFGFDRDFDFVPHVASALGVQLTTYGVADSLKPIYGSRPVTFAIFMRLRPFSAEEK